MGLQCKEIMAYWLMIYNIKWTKITCTQAVSASGYDLNMDVVGEIDGKRKIFPF